MQSLYNQARGQTAIVTPLEDYQDIYSIQSISCNTLSNLVVLTAKSSNDKVKTMVINLDLTENAYRRVFQIQNTALTNPVMILTPDLVRQDFVLFSLDASRTTMLSYEVNRNGYSITLENFDQSRKYFNMNRSGLVMKY